MKLVNIQPNEQKPYAGKKYALMKGIEMAKFNTIVVTDADCRPATTHWLAKMVGTYIHDTKIVLGHSPYEKGKGFLNSIIRYENFITALQYLGFATLGLPYMGVGRNMSYKKEILKGFTGFEDNKTLLTGDDDLLVNAAATGRNTEICIDKDAFMYTKPATTFSQWLNQKKRHLRSGFKYKLHHQLLLFIFALSNFVVYATFIALLATRFQLKTVLAVFMVLTVVKLLVTFKVYNKLAVRDLRFISPVLDIAYSGYLLIIFLLLLLKPKDNWRT
jgi:cellulose synthase/poly-beta-1,6-N-acetylglucosamine synthase-like glycosyltransferase